MSNQFTRTEQLLGRAAMARLAACRVAVFGLGGVGSFVAEGLVRAGVGNFLLVDHDRIALTNLNRQVHATMRTVGNPKATMMGQRMQEINPRAGIVTWDDFYQPERAEEFFTASLDYVVDAVDTVTAKISLVLESQKRGIPIISSMGTGNKLDPARLEIADIYDTSVCPLARVMRRELKSRDVKSLKVIYSKEPPFPPAADAPPAEDRISGRPVPGSVSFVPSVAGLMIAGEVVKDLIGLSRRDAGPAKDRKAGEEA
ncbi:MAG: tRNA threonylcarbamoyladenosine dehydratase [Schwartzia sp.]|nr:tRNA threonylcarbamoyladenosine dehydratase [Schwartzia sp. (in: firmicutes)]